MSALIFIYGTLHPDRAPAEIAPTARLLKPFGRAGTSRATVQGRLYHLGAYPGVLLSDEPKDIVAGDLFEIPNDPEVLARLDEYEDFRPGDPSSSLFLRQRTQATLADGIAHECWVYTYNRQI